MQLPPCQADFQKYGKVCWNLAIVLEKMIILVRHLCDSSLVGSQFSRPGNFFQPW